MPSYAYTARDESGNASNGILQASSVSEAGQLIRQGGKYPISVRPTNQSESSSGGNAMLRSTSSRQGGVKISRIDVIQLSTQLAIMVETGVTVTEALDCISQQASKPTVKRLTEDLSTSVQSGTDLSSALSRHPRSFPRLFVALIRASEKSGMLTRLLHRATAYLRDEHEIIRRVRGALTYPCIMFGFALTTTIFLLAFVLPRFTVIYSNKGAALPVPTKILMSLSDFFVGNWMGLIVGTIATVIGGFFYFRTESGKRMWHTVQLGLPLLGPMFRKLYLARSLRMIGTMAGAGINLVECVNTANDLCGNFHFQRMWGDVSSKIQQGKAMADSIGASSLVPRSVVQMIHSGEKGGKLAHVMEQVATYSEQELKETIADLTRYIEPIMIVLMGLIIGGVALALMLPIFTISRVVAH